MSVRGHSTTLVTDSTDPKSTVTHTGEQLTSGERCAVEVQPCPAEFCVSVTPSVKYRSPHPATSIVSEAVLAAPRARSVVPFGPKACNSASCV